MRQSKCSVPLPSYIEQSGCHLAPLLGSAQGEHPDTSGNHLPRAESSQPPDASGNQATVDGSGMADLPTVRERAFPRTRTAPAAHARGAHQPVPRGRVACRGGGRRVHRAVQRPQRRTAAVAPVPLHLPHRVRGRHRGPARCAAGATTGPAPRVLRVVRASRSWRGGVVPWADCHAGMSPTRTRGPAGDALGRGRAQRWGRSRVVPGLVSGSAGLQALRGS